MNISIVYLRSEINCLISNAKKVNLRSPKNALNKQEARGGINRKITHKNGTNNEKCIICHFHYSRIFPILLPRKRRHRINDKHIVESQTVKAMDKAV